MASLTLFRTVSQELVVVLVGIFFGVVVVKTPLELKGKLTRM